MQLNFIFNKRSIWETLGRLSCCFLHITVKTMLLFWLKHLTEASICNSPTYYSSVPMKRT